MHLASVGNDCSFTPTSHRFTLAILNPSLAKQNATCLPFATGQRRFPLRLFRLSFVLSSRSSLLRLVIRLHHCWICPLEEPSFPASTPGFVQSLAPRLIRSAARATRRVINFQLLHPSYPLHPLHLSCPSCPRLSLCCVQALRGRFHGACRRVGVRPG